MADYFRKGKSLYASTANTFGTGTGETITPASVSGLPTDTEITLTFDRVDSSGTATPTKMERIIGTISGGNFVTRTSPSSGRGADGSTEQAHTSPVVEYIPNAKDMNDQIDGFLVQHLQTGAHSNITASNIAASSIQINQVTVPTISSTSTLTNKRVTPRVVSTTDDSTSVIDIDNTDEYVLTAVANATTFTLSGTPTDRQKLIVSFKDAGVAKALTWTGFTSRGATLPTTTVAGKWHNVGCKWNATASSMDCVVAIVEA